MKEVAGADMTDHLQGERRWEPVDDRSASVVGVILSFNAGDMLSATVAAVQAQTLPLRSLVVVDNASTDGSPGSILAIGGPVDVVVLPENVGVGAGHNFGWRLACAVEPAVEYVWALEHDSVPAPDCLERLVATFRSMDPDGNRVAAVVPRQRHPDDAVGDVGRKRGPVIQGEPPYPPARMTFNAALIRTSAIGAAGPLREDFFVGQEDREYALRLARAGYVVVHDSSAVVIHRNKGASRRHRAASRHRRERESSHTGYERSIARDYYSARNALYLHRSIRREPWALGRSTGRSLLHLGWVLLRGDAKAARASARLMALWDGALGRMGRRDYWFTRGTARG